MQADEQRGGQRRVGPLNKLMRVCREQSSRLADTGDRTAHRGEFTFHHVAITLDGFTLFSTVHDDEWMIVRDRNEGHLQDLLGTDLPHARENDIAYIDAL